MTKKTPPPSPTEPETGPAHDLPGDDAPMHAFGPLTEAGKSFAATPVNLARIGLNQVAYVRRAMVNDVKVWSIHAATGDAIGAAQTFDQAWGAIKQHNMEPLRVN
ncbi:MAG: hypothetical protein SFV21_07545 [Rhodospirillaceae bacterium]|nr:hypothetical protein [Rhodospirillaceae bacterium]